MREGGKGSLAVLGVIVPAQSSSDEISLSQTRVDPAQTLSNLVNSFTTEREKG
jgi:hypothetical protein